MKSYQHKEGVLSWLHDVRTFKKAKSAFCFNQSLQRLESLIQRQIKTGSLKKSKSTFTFTLCKAQSKLYYPESEFYSDKISQKGKVRLVSKTKTYF